MSELIIHSFWDAMGSNNFDQAAKWLHPAFEYFMPQTNEYLSGRDDFVQLNKVYPAEGKWRFTVETIVASGNTAVSDVKVTDGAMNARAVTFHTLQDGLIRLQKEFWPDTYPAPKWRARLMTIVDKPPF